MSNHLRILCLILGLMAFASASVVAESPNDRIKKRLPTLFAAKDAGTLGEGADGYVHARSGGNPATADLIKNENADRRALFASIAKKTGGSIAAVAKEWSALMKTKGKKGHWYRDAKGNWRQK